MVAYRWSGPLAAYDQPTGDSRMFQAGSVASRNLPMPLRYGLLGGHNPAVDVGAITSLDLDHSEQIRATGVFLPEEVEPYVRAAVYKAKLGIAQPSLDLEPRGLDFDIVDHDGGPVRQFRNATMMGATLVSFPAFGNQPLDVDSDEPFGTLVASAAAALGWTIEEIPDEMAVALVAAANHSTAVADDLWMEALEANGFVAGGGPLAPSVQYFTDPGFTKRTPLEITQDGRVRGHLAAWGVCHTGVGNKCILAPHTKTNYQKFHQGTVITAEGEALRVGKITLGAGHADTKLGLIPATEHYDNSATATAVVQAGEDRFGIWVSGALLPGVTPERTAELRRSPLSGDWRLDQEVHNLELIAALAVNSPGFPIFSMEDGEQMSLCAAGMVYEGMEVAEEAPADDGQEERRGRLAAILVADELRRQNERAAKLAALSGGK